MVLDSSSKAGVVSASSVSVTRKGEKQGKKGLLRLVNVTVTARVIVQASSLGYNPGKILDIT
jgi:hypothetical protein